MFVVMTVASVVCATAKWLGTGAFVFTVMALPIVSLGVLLRVTSGRTMPGFLLGGMTVAAPTLVAVSFLILGDALPNQRLKLLAGIAVLALFGLGGMTGGGVHAIRLGYGRVGWTMLILVPLILLWFILPVRL